MQRVPHGALLIGLFFLLSNQVSADEETYHFDATVGGLTIYDVEEEGTEFKRGDIFHVQFTLDVSITDHDPDPESAWFQSNLIELTFVRDSGNVGTWDPSVSGSWVLPHGFHAVNGSAGMALASFDFPPVNVHGVPLTRPEPTFIISGSDNDTGFGQPWHEIFGPVTGAQIAFYFTGDPTNSIVGFITSNFGVGPHPELLPPVADAGLDQSVHCDGYDGAEVLLDGSYSFDQSGDDLRYEWSVAEWSGIVLEDPTSPVTAGLFPIGVHEVTLTVYDVDEYGADIGGTDSDSVIITVYDDEPPVAMVTTDVATLFPANGDMLPVTIYVEASDYCTDPNDLSIFCYVSSDQPDAAGNSNRTGDVNGFDGYVEPVEVSLLNIGNGLYEAEIELRAERVSTARTYSIGLMVEDASGNFGEASTTVVVPHDRRRN